MNILKIINIGKSSLLVASPHFLWSDKSSLMLYLLKSFFTLAHMRSLYTVSLAYNVAVCHCPLTSVALDMPKPSQSCSSSIFLLKHRTFTSCRISSFLLSHLVVPCKRVILHSLLQVFLICRSHSHCNQVNPRPMSTLCHLLLIKFKIVMNNLWTQKSIQNPLCKLVRAALWLPQDCLIKKNVLSEAILVVIRPNFDWSFSKHDRFCGGPWGP